MNRLVIVSNRVPLPDEDGNPPAGGLAVALHAALRKRGGGLWMGWSGKVQTEAGTEQLEEMEIEGITYALTDLSETDYNEYYAGFANRVLWPIFHSRLDLAEYARKEMSGYFRVNRLFADLLAPRLQEDDVVWIHDYHLIPLAEELRQRGVTCRIGFFLHIPWPPSDILIAMPVYERVLKALCAYDVLGFQTDLDLANFSECLRRENVGGPVGERTFRAYDRTFEAGAFPISIETADFARLAEAADSGDELVESTKNSLTGKQLIIGADRLDYSKGITHRIEAYERLLIEHPERRGNISFLQVTPKSRSDVPEYAAMQKQLAELIGRVNGALGSADWVPTRYINQSLGRSVLAGLYRLADVGLVTPLKDGMNLVAKEYVAAQDPEDPGVLVLSRFAGAARELKGALLINPYDSEMTARTIERALSMPLDERRERWRGMMDHLLTHDVNHWCEDFLAALNAPR
ncbi:alpha,alpha-trehalose-phosphate synthase (UDP-forming) [Pleomorphomonas sp. NRK KF1]|uniref:alpha,alpha-trehalose-phosphate synthase (UDP-forming) n=1 Tax=Pleomorphomonas sp. NRK KF1 TaxID=2943000 RepID=UPI0020430470|nr:alpha,alpha-trehalose-phosphate synthase (UDP-forming) [Pleomorphomonas sp. NRK KF1]MCM5553586.1 alpha,alpha-trehalose-phosphate synthase (UDP-forming) [Pleomorphomonas sp. NRK KF1]